MKTKLMFFAFLFLSSQTQADVGQCFFDAHPEANEYGFSFSTRKTEKERLDKILQTRGEQRVIKGNGVEIWHPTREGSSETCLAVVHEIPKVKTKRLYR